jgi:hypothetical protein
MFHEPGNGNLNKLEARSLLGISLGQPRRSRQSVRAYIFLTEQVVVRGRYEILTALPFGFNWKLKKPVNMAKKSNKTSLHDEEFQAISKLAISDSQEINNSVSITNEIPEIQEGEKRFGVGFPNPSDTQQIYFREEILVDESSSNSKNVSTLKHSKITNDNKNLKVSKSQKGNDISRKRKLSKIILTMIELLVVTNCQLIIILMIVILLIKIILSRMTITKY